MGNLIKKIFIKIIENIPIISEHNYLRGKEDGLLLSIEIIEELMKDYPIDKLLMEFEQKQTK